MSSEKLLGAWGVTLAMSEALRAVNTLGLLTVQVSTTEVMVRVAGLWSARTDVPLST